MVFEGIVVNKVPYKERDLIVKLLLRSGNVASFYVYGGQGGGKKSKPMLYELGCMMRVQPKEQRSKLDGSELLVASEAVRTWEPQHVRHNVQAFYMMCLYFEIIQKFALPYEAGQSEYASDHEGVFSVVSNAIFHVDDALGKQKFEAAQHLNLFLIKLLHHLGIMPDTDNCSYCSCSLIEAKGVTFLADRGQFACLSCVTADDERGLLFRIKKGFQTKYTDYSELTGTQMREADKLIQFFCHHFHLRPVELKTYSLLLR